MSPPNPTNRMSSITSAMSFARHGSRVPLSIFMLMRSASRITLIPSIVLYPRGGITTSSVSTWTGIVLSPK